jgi:glycine dehydrogenase subunit 1
MLRAVGANGIDDLFESVPSAVRLGRPLDMPDGVSEMEAASAVRALADANTPATRLVSFAGAGCYDHYVPAVVDHVVRRPEFFTAYTPYQPEVSQGTLQNIYEFQTMICELTGMDVANASMYDGATAFVEAALMASRVTKRHKVVVAGSVHPEWRVVLSTYAASGNIEVVTCPVLSGVVSAGAAADLIDDSSAALLVSSPNFLGHLEDLAALGEVARAAGALFVVSVNPILSGVLEPPSSFGADIVVGEGQPLGNPMSLGGPGLGFFACREAHLRQLPGRIVGRTVDVDGRGAFVLTMQTREQHIRREKATSNICSNHALNALAAAVYLSAVGAAGLASVGRACVAKAHYLREALLATGAFDAPYDAPFANEFALRYKGDPASMHAEMVHRGFLAGVDLGRIDPGMDGLVLFAVTEKRTRAEMDALVREVASL